jgi:hypothetical protein
MSRCTEQSSVSEPQMPLSAPKIQPVKAAAFQT